MAYPYFYLSPEKITLQLVGQERFLHSHLFFHRIFKGRPGRTCIGFWCPGGKPSIQQFSHNFKSVDFKASINRQIINMILLFCLIYFSCLWNEFKDKKPSKAQ